MILITGCEGPRIVIEGIRSDGCAWTSPIYLSEASLTALRSAQEENPDVQMPLPVGLSEQGKKAIEVVRDEHPEVRIDRESMALHNKLYERNCPNEK